MSKFSPLSVRNPLDELARVLNSFGHRYRIDQVFYDWIEMAAITLSNTVDRAQWADREARYMAIVSRYTKDEAKLMAEMLALLMLSLERGLGSPFGELMSKLELHSAGTRKRMGQFFTPFNVSYMMAQMSLAPADKLAEQIAEKGFITMAEPACGAGGMVMAFAKAMEDAGFNYQKHLHVTAVDVDATCTHMTYVLASLTGIPAVVQQGDTLRGTVTATWFTPFHVLWGWNRRLYGDAKQPDQATEIAVQEPALGPPELPELDVSEQAEPATPPLLPDKPIAPSILAKWRINWDPAGPTLTLP